MNAIIKKLQETRMNYCHALEVESIYDIENAIESIAGEGWSKSDLIEFFKSISIYYLGDDDATEDEIYAFDLVESIEANF